LTLDAQSPSTVYAGTNNGAYVIQQPVLDHRIYLPTIMR